MGSQELTDTVSAAILVEYTVTSGDIAEAGRLTKAIASTVRSTLDDVGAEITHAHAFVGDAATEMTEARRRILADDATT
jgi:hypothetical protein